MLDTSNVFLTGVALEALSQWSSRLKAFQQNWESTSLVLKHVLQRMTISRHY
ncbi:hypothetical protein [Chroococcidiopsis sp. SAG 2025]|uniref:hypothetical protein n=1 Tax=Chroococcidiopsis sp. SAG 2025 TaxID=171389 RepID=UPI002937201F|nr:hypothetical protein [Chroococcidiopsis sp. SAG 2025]